VTRIKILPQEVAHKIAAGEVIERPASVIKELAENSIDAQSTQITLEIRNGGIELIRVQDNGIGIAKDELELAFQPHATSKISNAEDLFSLYTLGFRGEALPSMASISKLTLYSRPSYQEHGYKIYQKSGEFVVEPVGTPEGTTVVVEDLFYNVPARLKFLKSAATERRRVLDMATRLALAHPHVAFRVIAEGKPVLSTPGNGRLLDTILLVEGKNIAPELIKFNNEFAWGQVQGYLGSARLAKGNRSGEVFVMNGRVVYNETIRSALEKAYEGLLKGRMFPWAVVAIELNPELVDCNVHPAKEEIRFAEEQILFSDLIQAFRSALRERNLAPKVEKREIFAKTSPKTAVVQEQLQWAPQTWEHVDKVLREYRPERTRDTEAAFAPTTIMEPKPKAEVVQEEKAELDPNVEAEQTESGLEETRNMLINGRIIGQLLQTYILLEALDGLWIIDQHIVHERILLEELEEAWETSTIHVQEIIPQLIEFTPSEAALVNESIKILARYGLELDDFGNNSFLLRTVPSSVAEKGSTWKEEILSIAETSKKTSPSTKGALITLACRGAIKAGEYLDMKQMKSLLAALAKTENPFTCPHGRPIIIRLENKELLRRFGRI